MMSAQCRRNKDVLRLLHGVLAVRIIAICLNGAESMIGTNAGAGVNVR